MHRITLVLLSALVTLSACKAKESFDNAQIAENLEDKGTMELMNEVSEDEYEGPADGRLTDAQIQMYLKVREKEKAIAQVAKNELQQNTRRNDGEKSLASTLDGLKGLGAAADLLTADLRAAKELGFNSQEYMWVKTQVLSASGLEMQEKSQKALNQVMDQSYLELKKQHDQTTDAATKAALASMLSDSEKSRKEMASTQPELDQAAVYNRELLRKYENALNAIAQELAKWEDKPGDVQKSMDEYQQNLDKAASGKANNG